MLYLKISFISIFLLISAVGCTVPNNENTTEEYTQTENNYNEIYMESTSEQFSSNTSEENSSMNKKYSESDFSYIKDFGDDIPISRAYVAKMISLVFCSDEEIYKSERKITFNDTDISKWYDKYINAVFIKNFMSGVGDGKSFSPDEYLSVTQAQFLADRLDENNKIKIRLDDQNKDKAISLALWNEIFIKVLENLSKELNYCQKFGISQIEAVVIATEKNNNNIKNNYVITDSGVFKCEGFELSYYLDKKISFIAKNDKIITVLSVMNNLQSMNDVYFIGKNEHENKIIIFAGGAEREYYIEPNSNININDNKNNSVVDVIMKNGNIIDIIYNDNYIEGEIKNFDKDGIVIGENEKISFSQNIKIYLTSNSKIIWGNIEDIKTSQNCICYIKNEKISSIVIL